MPRSLRLRVAEVGLDHESPPARRVALMSALPSTPTSHHRPPRELGAAPGLEPPAMSVHSTLGKRGPGSHL